MVHIYWGMGKGKTSTLNGSAIRAKGAGMKVAMFKFLKGSEKPSSEDRVLEKMGIRVMNAQSISKFVTNMSPEERMSSRDQTISTLKFIEMNSRNYDLVLFDEFLDLAATNVNFMTGNQMAKFLKKINCEVMISGHTKVKEIFDMADLVTEFTSTKHYYEKDVKARKGIEF